MAELKEIVKALEVSWARDTAFDNNDWSPENPARGHCVVSCLIVQDYFGGELLGYSVEGPDIRETHFVNQLEDGTVIDTTRSQYTDTVQMTLKSVRLEGFESIREKRLGDDDTRRRYELLKGRVEAYVARHKAA